MNINRANYEMYFLLYVDNELPAAERNAVENFLSENIDLESEFEILMEATLPPEKIMYTSKADLYKKELDITLSQEKLLLHLDNEMDLPSAKSILEEIAANPSLDREWSILQRTKLDPSEKIVFENKKVLYRHETHNLVSMSFWRAAVAAAILGACIFIGIAIFTKEKNIEKVAINSNGRVMPQNNSTLRTKFNKAGENNSSVQSPVENVAATEVAPVSIPAGERITQDQSLRKDLSTTSIKNGKALGEGNNIAVTVPENSTIISPVEKENNNLSKSYFENINDKKSNKIASLSVKDIMIATRKNDVVKTDDNIIAQNGAVLQISDAKDNDITETVNSYAKTAVMDGPVDEVNDNHILFINEEKINRSKLSGIFRKVKRVLTRNANINTGGSLRIAGFEIAAR